jgi:hypothetical protein
MFPFDLLPPEVKLEVLRHIPNLNYFSGTSRENHRIVEDDALRNFALSANREAWKSAHPKLLHYHPPDRIISVLLEKAISALQEGKVQDAEHWMHPCFCMSERIKFNEKAVRKLIDAACNIFNENSTDDVFQDTLSFLRKTTTHLNIRSIIATTISGKGSILKARISAKMANFDLHIAAYTLLVSSEFSAIADKDVRVFTRKLTTATLESIRHTTYVIRALAKLTEYQVPRGWVKRLLVDVQLRTKALLDNGQVDMARETFHVLSSLPDDVPVPPKYFEDILPRFENALREDIANRRWYPAEMIIPVSLPKALTYSGFLSVILQQARAASTAGKHDHVWNILYIARQVPGDRISTDILHDYFSLFRSIATYQGGWKACKVFHHFGYKPEANSCPCFEDWY